MSYTLLLIILIAITVMTYYIFDRDILSPSFLTSAVFSFCVLMALIGLKSWNNVGTLSILTQIIIIFGVVSFCCGEGIVKKVYKTNKKRKHQKLKVINVSKWKWIVLIVFTLITIVLLVFEIRRICLGFNYDSRNIFQMLRFYRTKTNIFSNEMVTNGLQVNFIVRQMRKCATIIASFALFVLINNFMCKDNKKNLVLPLILFLLSLINTIFISGGRSYIMHFLVAAVFLFIYLYREKYKLIKIKTVCIACIAILSFCLLFYYMLPLFGRKTSVRIDDYISFYLGASVPSLDNYLRVKSESNIIGEETFANVYTSAKKIGIGNFKGSEYRYNWVDFKPAGKSNIYTGLRNYYNDFGLLGVIILRIIAAIVISYYYYKLKNNELSNIWLIVYTHYFYILIEQIRGETFFSLISSSTFSMIILFICVYYYLFVFNYTFFKHRIRSVIKRHMAYADK